MLYHPSISVSHNYDRHQIQCNRSYSLCSACRCMCICVSVCTCECICIGASTCSSLCVAQCFVCTYTLVLIYCHSCQPLRFGHSLLRPSALRYTVTLMMISLCSCLKNKDYLFSTPCACGGIKFTSDQLHASFSLAVLQPIAICVLNPPTSRSVQFTYPHFIHHFLARLPFSIISTH